MGKNCLLPLPNLNCSKHITRFYENQIRKSKHTLVTYNNRESKTAEHLIVILLVVIFNLTCSTALGLWGRAKKRENGNKTSLRTKEICRSPGIKQLGNTESICIYFYRAGYYKYCLGSTNCPSCIRQVYLNLFSTSRCLASIGKSQLDCKEHHFTHTYTAPSTAGTYDIKVIV